MDLDPGAGTDNATSNGGLDTFVVKLDSTGAYQWGATWGYTGDEEVTANTASGPDGSVYVLNPFLGTIDFDPGAPAASSTSAGSWDGYVSKFNASGTWQWTKTWGGTSHDLPSRVRIASDGSVYVLGRFYSTSDFDPGAGTENKTSAGDADAFLLKLDSDGLFQWVQTWGGTGFDTVYDFAFDASGNIYITGEFSGTVDFDTGAGTSNATSTGSSDAFLSKFNSSGTWQWTKTWGGTGADKGLGVEMTTDGLVAFGNFTGTVDFDPSGGTSNKTSAGGLDAFISTFDTDGTHHRTDTFGGTLDDYPDSRAPQGITSSMSNVVFSGFYKSAPADFNPAGAKEEYSSNGTSMYLISFDLIEPAVTVSSTAATVTEGASDEATYTLALRTPPDDDVTVLVSPGPQLYADVASVTFASSTWNVPQTVTLTAADDNSIEDSHTGTVTHTVSSTASEYDGLSVSSVSIPITDNDARGSGGGGGDGDDDNDDPGNVPEVTPPQDTPIGTTPPGLDLAALATEIREATTPTQLQAIVHKLQAYIVTLLQQRIRELQAQIAGMHPN